MRVSNTLFAATLLLALPTLAGAKDPSAGLVSLVRLELDNFRAERPSDRSNNDLERVIARYSETIMLDPKDDDAYFRRGIANFYAGSVPKALSDINRARDLDPNYPYYPLWLHIVAQRGRLPSRLAEAVAHIDMTKWPAPIIRLFLGQTTREAALAAAADPDAQKRREQLCEAHFYIGQIALQQSALDEAAQLFHLAADECPREFVEAPAASAELTVLAGRH